MGSDSAGPRRPPHPRGCGAGGASPPPHIRLLRRRVSFTILIKALTILIEAHYNELRARCCGAHGRTYLASYVRLLNPRQDDPILEGASGHLNFNRGHKLRLTEASSSETAGVSPTSIRKPPSGPGQSSYQTPATASPAVVHHQMED